MIKYIDGKKYNSDTGKKVGSWSNQDIEETLQKNKSGAYFIYGKGGAFGEYIVAQTFDDAQTWAKKYLSDADYSKEFEIGTEDDDLKIHISPYISPKAKKILDIKVSKTGKSVSEIVNELILTLVNNE